MMKPKSLRACIQRMLPEIETMLVMGTTRDDVYSEVCKRYGLEKTTIRNFDTSLYRARQTARKVEGVLHNTEDGSSKDVLHNTEDGSSKGILHNTESVKPGNDVLHNTDENEEVEKPEPRGILDKKFFDEVNAFDPKQFNDKYK